LTNLAISTLTAMHYMQFDIIKQMAKLTHRPQVRAAGASCFVAEMRGRQNDFSFRMSRSRVIDFVATTSTMLPAFALALALLLATCVSRSAPNLEYDLFPVPRVITCPSRC
jgi:hypothetical protein